MLPGISSRFSCRSGRSSAANVLPHSPGTPEVVSLTQANTIPQRSGNPNRRSVREGGQYITRAVCFLHGNFSKISRRSQNGLSGRWEERYQLRQSERESEFQAVQHRVRSGVRKHLWTPSAERLMCYWLLPLFNVNLMFCSLSLQPVPCYHADLNNTGIVIYTNNYDLWTWRFKKYFVLCVTERRDYWGGIEVTNLGSKRFQIFWYTFRFASSYWAILCNCAFLCWQDACWWSEVEQWRWWQSKGRWRSAALPTATKLTTNQSVRGAGQTHPWCTSGWILPAQRQTPVVISDCLQS